MLFPFFPHFQIAKTIELSRFQYLMNCFYHIAHIGNIPTPGRNNGGEKT